MFWQGELKITINMPITEQNIKTKIPGTKINKYMTTANNANMKIKKRDGRLEPLDINKIHFVVEEACEGLSGVSASQIQLKIYKMF